MALKVGVDGKFLNAVNTHYDTYNRITSKSDEFYLYGTGKLEDEENNDGTKYRHDRVGRYTYSGGNAWRSYTPAAYNYAALSNPDEWVSGNTLPPNNNFLYAQGKLFAGAPGTDVGANTDRGAVSVIFPHRMKSGLSTDFQYYDLPEIVADTYGTHFSVFTSSESENSMQFGYSLAFTRGQLFVGAPYKNDNYTDEGRIYRYTGDYTYGTPTETKYDAGTIGDAGGLDFSNFTNNQRWGKVISGANGVLGVGSELGCAYITHLARKESDWDDWIKLDPPSTPTGQTGNDQKFGFNVKVGCGRVVVVSRYYDTASFTDAGAFSIYDYYGNHIRTVTNPDGALSNAQFGHSIAIGCGRIVCSGRVGLGYRDFYIFDLDGDLVKKVSSTVFSPYYESASPLAVGFGRIACVSPYRDGTSAFNTGEAALFDLDGNLIGQNLIPVSESSGTDDRDQYLGYGGLAIGPDRLYAAASAHTAYGTRQAAINEWPIHTSMTRWDVEAMEDGDV